MRYSSENSHKIHPHPGSELFIYYIQGRVQDLSGQNLGDHFIGNWEEDDFSFLFFSKSSEKIVSQLVARQSNLRLLDRFQMSYDQWQGGELTSVLIDPFLIVPPWEDNGIFDQQDSTKIVLDPGVVFGNGLHPTTRDCIEALAWLCSFCDVSSALDLGCGTGILALAACKLGCKKCLALDFNLLACQTAFRNVKLNGLTGSILVARAKAEKFVHSPGELLMANIHYDIMERLLNEDGFFEKKWFILSGLLKSQAGSILEQLKRPGVNILRKWERDGIWHTFLGQID